MWDGRFGGGCAVMCVDVYANAWHMFGNMCSSRFHLFSSGKGQKNRQV